MKKIFLASLMAFTSLCVFGDNVTLTVNNTKYQKVKGFGAFVCSPQFGYGHMSESEIRQVWGPNSTLKCNIMRLYLPIGESSFYQSLSTAQLAKNLGLFVFASPWSMPAEWKTYNTVNANSSGNENHLKTAYYDTYANYLNNYVTYLKNNGVNLDAISVQNEPDWKCDYAGCIFSTTEMVNFLANSASKINCKVIAPETIGMSDNYANALYNSSAALANFEIYGGHQYAGVGSAFKNLANKGKELWMTEYLINWTEGSSGQDRNFSWASDAFNFATAINTCMLNNVNAWVHYTAKRFYGLMGDGQRGTTSGQITKRGYIMGNFSKYITGSTRLGSSFSSSALSGSTYLSQTGDTIFAVIINSSSNSHNLTVSLPFYTKGGKQVVTSSSKNLQEQTLSFSNATAQPSVTIEASSVTTLVFVSNSSVKTADFDYDLATGRYVADPNDLTIGGDLQYNSSTGVLTLPAGKTGTLTLAFGNADFSNVSKVKMSREGDDLFNTLMIKNTAGNSVNTDGGAFYNSKYELNYSNYQGNSSSVGTLVWTGTNDGSESKTMTLRQILIQVDVMRAEQKHEQSLSRWSFGVWDGIGANATRTGDDDDMEYNIDEVISGYGTIYGNGSVLASHYVDLSSYSRLRVYGDNGLSVRALFNRSTDTSSDYVEKSGTLTNGVFEVNLAEVGSYAHMNALKVNGGTGSAWRVMVVDDSDPMDYRLSGKLYVADNLSAALSDGNATNYDATELRNSSAVALTPSNRNALFYVDNASRLSNSSNVVVKSGSSYSSGSIVLTDPASAAGDIAGAYFPGGSVKSGNATWSDSGNGAYSFHWSAGTAAEVQIFNYILERQGYKRLVVETTSFTKPWGIRFYDVDGNVITSQGYWAGQHDGNRIKDIDIDSLFAANNVSSKRSTLTMVRLYNISDEEGEVVLKSAYLCNHLSECNYPFYAPYDITASSATLNSYVPDAGFTTVTVPFSASVPSGHSAYALSTSGATSVSGVEANRPVLLTGSGEAVFSASNVVVKATDGLTSGTLQGTYRQLTPSVGYAQRDDSPANVESFTPVDGVTLYAVTASSSVTLYPFRAYATDAVVVDPIDPIDPIEITVTSAGVATAYLPYDALVPDVDFFVVAAVKEVSGSTAYLKEVRGEIIPANTGVMIFANPGTYTFTPSPTDCTENVESLLHGVTENTSVQTLVQREGKSIYVLSRGIKEYTGFKVAGGTVKTIGAYKAYLPVDESIETLTKFISISFGGDNALDIDLLKSDTHEQTGGIFDVTGRRVMTPEKGIYIVNGKKVLYK
jgi:O-glycosyl hydrolase